MIPLIIFITIIYVAVMGFTTVCIMAVVNEVLKTIQKVKNCGVNEND